MENACTYEGDSIFLEHDYCCNYVNIDNNNNGNDDGNESKERVLRTKYNRAFSAVDKWVDSIISRVPTGNDTMRKIVDREITIHKVKYPFLPEQQIRGKVYKKFGIPSVMGGVLNKSTFRGSSLKNRARKRRRAIKKMDLKRELEDIKIDKKFFKLSEEQEELAIKNVSSTLDLGVRNLECENSWQVQNSLMKQYLKREQKETQDVESPDFLTILSPLNIEDLEKEKTQPSARPHLGLGNSQKWEMSDIFKTELQNQTNCTIRQTFDKELKNSSSMEYISVHSQPTQIKIPSLESPHSVKHIPEQGADVFKKELLYEKNKCVTRQALDKQLKNSSSIENVSMHSQPTQIIVPSFGSPCSTESVPKQIADDFQKELQSGKNNYPTHQALSKKLKNSSSIENISVHSQPTQIIVPNFGRPCSMKSVPKQITDVSQKELKNGKDNCTTRNSINISIHSQPTQIIIPSLEGPCSAEFIPKQRADIFQKDVQIKDNCRSRQTCKEELKNPSSVEKIFSQPTQFVAPSFENPRSAESVPKNIHTKIDTCWQAAIGTLSEELEDFDLENATSRSKRSQLKRFSSCNKVSDYLDCHVLQKKKKLNPKTVESENRCRNILGILGILKSVGNTERLESPVKLVNCYSDSKKQGRLIKNISSFERESDNRELSMKINSTTFQNDNRSDKYHGEINVFEDKENIPGCSIPALTGRQELSWRKHTLSMDKGPLEERRRICDPKSPMKSEVFQTAKINNLQQDFTNLKSTDARLESGRTNVKIIPKIFITGHVDVPRFVMIEPLLSNHCCEYNQDFDKVSTFRVGSMNTSSLSDILKSDEMFEISESIEKILDFLDKDCEKN